MKCLLVLLSLVLIFTKAASASPPLQCRGLDHSNIKNVIVTQCKTIKDGLPNCILSANNLNQQCLISIANAARNSKDKCACYLLTYLNEKNLDVVFQQLNSKDPSRQASLKFKADIAAAIRKHSKSPTEIKVAYMRVIADIEDPVEIERTLIPGLFDPVTAIWQYAADGIHKLMVNELYEGWEEEYYIEKLGEALSGRSFYKNKYHRDLLPKGAEKKLCEIFTSMGQKGTKYIQTINSKYIIPSKYRPICLNKK